MILTVVLVKDELLAAGFCDSSGFVVMAYLGVRPGLLGAVNGITVCVTYVVVETASTRCP